MRVLLEFQHKMAEFNRVFRAAHSQFREGVAFSAIYVPDGRINGDAFQRTCLVHTQVSNLKSIPQHPQKPKKLGDGIE